MANCKNHATCGNTTNPIPNTNPVRYYDLCPACSKSKNSSTTPTNTKTVQSKSDIEITGEKILEFPDKLVVNIELKTKPKAKIRVKHDLLEQKPERADKNGELVYKLPIDLTNEKSEMKIRFISETGREVCKDLELPAISEVATVTEQQKPSTIKIILQDAVVVGDEIEVKFEIKTSQPKASVLFLKGFENLEPARNTDRNGKRLFIRREAKTEGGKTIPYRFVVDDLSSDEVQATITLPEIPKVKEPCPHCNGTKVCTNHTIQRNKCSCRTCRSKVGEKNLLATVKCSFCS